MVLHRPLRIKTRPADLSYVSGVPQMRFHAGQGREKQNKLGIDRNRTVWQSPERRHGGPSWVIVVR
jgi:hypothetical protein